MRVSVPASIANLGPGFDLLAMAVDLWLDVEAEPADEPEWRFEGEGAGYLTEHPNPISKLCLRGVARSDIPLGVGLGSSAAARLAALMLLHGSDKSTLPRPGATLIRAVEAEGHPDNAAAAHKGGVILVLGNHIHRLPVPDLEVALLVASEPYPTEEARKVVPRELTRADAVFNAGRMALLVHALHEKRWGLLSTAMEDRIHQPYRLQLYPWVKGVMTAARYAGAHGAALAGAGPSVFAFCEPGRGQEVAEAMAEAGKGKGRPLVTRVSEKGLQWVP